VHYASVKAEPIARWVPTLLRYHGYVFFFRSSDGGEPPHVHVEGNGGRAKIWLTPSIEVVRQRAYSKEQIAEVIRVTERHREEWITAWQEFFAR